RLRADRHERGRRHHAVGGGDLAASRSTIASEEAKGEALEHQLFTPSCPATQSSLRRLRKLVCAAGHPRLIPRPKTWDGRAKLGHDDQSRSFSEEQAGIAVGIKSIIAPARMRVSTLHDIEPAKSGNQHEQGRARQME